MYFTFLEKDAESRQLILFFPGWSCGPELLHSFRLPGWDVAVVEDYASAALDVDELRKYDTIYLFAWSLGVFMASMVDFKGKITAAYAINGTLQPVADMNGIPKEIYQSTANNLSPRNLQKFRRRVAGSSETFKEVFDKDFTEEQADYLRLQLYQIDCFQKTRTQFPLPWKRVVLSENDAIFPFSNMMRSWGEQQKAGCPEIITQSGPHYIPLQQIIRSTIPDKEKVSQRFSRSALSYDGNAIAQKKIAGRLADHLENRGFGKKKKILEIGSGTGLLTKEIVDRFSPSSIDFVELSDVRPEVAEVKTEFYKADAEEWIKHNTKSYEAVVSSSTLQWFVNLPLFIRHVADRLVEGGIFAFSTFLPGNLAELDSVRPSPLTYHSAQEIEAWMQPYFEEIKVKEEEIKLEFASVSQLLRHLEATGVRGSASPSKLPLSKLRNMKSLTYRTLYISGKKISNIL